MSDVIQEILEHNRQFVAEKRYEVLRTDRYPNKGVVVVSCMDTRLVELLPLAMDLRQGDAKLLKTAGAVVSHPFGSVMRSILVAVYDLHAQDICVVGHHDCGMMGFSCAHIVKKARERGISDDTFRTLKNSGIDLESWLVGFDNVGTAVKQSVGVIRNHPLLPTDVRVHGMLISPDTGKLELLDV
ncbi:MAG TPA: carbonic anhydrase [Tepidisphaeraceae bacterium]|jgi:carbonic anhydrase|nr:carbonic anhydrase [Tepidisphaeraceae bacterium]